MKAFAFTLLMFFSLTTLGAEVLSLPPDTYRQPFIENRAFSFVYSWFDIRQHAPSGRDLAPAWIMDTGSIFTFYSWKDMATEGMVRHIFLNRLDPDSYWIVWPLAIYTDLRLSFVYRIRELICRISFHHDCKHDIERNFGRDAIHEAVNLQFTHPPVTLDWPDNTTSSLLHGEINSRIHFSPLFQNRDIREPDIFCITLRGETDPVVIDEVFAVFLQVELDLLFRDPKSDVRVASGFAVDWSIRAGVRLFGREKGLSLYTNLESLSDDWLTNEPEEAVLFSFGLLFYI
ncbi:MAG: hypothetical protein JW881_16405 [Spirochaetales bacterium]|nr:hypothetical protein [Spirochaetales bacterium]